MNDYTNHSDIFPIVLKMRKRNAGLKAIFQHVRDFKKYDNFSDSLLIIHIISALVLNNLQYSKKELYGLSKVSLTAWNEKYPNYKKAFFKELREIIPTS